MARLNVGEQIQEFTFDTPFEKGRSLEETVRKATKTALLFLRYYGCPVCQVDIRQLAKNYERITEDEGQLLIVLQSTPETISSQLNRYDLPFEIICDPEQKLYHAFEIKPAESIVAMVDIKTVLKLAKGKVSGLKHGTYEGNEQQLPAAFVMDRERRLSYVHYAKTLSDMPDVDKLVSLLTLQKQEPKKKRKKEKKQPSKDTKEKITLKCPKCGKGEIVKGKTAWGCTLYHKSCDFLIPMEIQGKKLTEKQIETLVQKGQTGKISGFKDSAGNAYNGIIRLDANKQITIVPI